jgi:basic membrane protein A
VSPTRLITILAAINVVLIVVGAVVFGGGRERTGAGLRIGLVFDVGGKNDASFNESAWRGLLRARDDLGVEIDYIEPSEGADRDTALRTLAARHDDLVIAVGSVFGQGLERVASRFPDIKFAGIDYTPSAGVGELPNLAGIRFREHEGSFLVGAVAGLLTHTKCVGFVGGMRIPLIRKFEAGYTAGVHHVCPDCRVLSAYAGTEPKAFADPALGQELASSQYSDGADIIFHASGKTGDGVFAAARERELLAIGVDSDQYVRAPCCVVTSMIKRVDLAVLNIIKDVAGHRFHGGTHELGLEDNAITFVSDERNRAMLPLEIVQRVRALGEQIKSGKIVVPFE